MNYQMVTIKALVLAAWTSVWAIIMPVSHFIAFTFILVISDLVTGLIAARTKGVPIQSRRMSRSVTKSVLYMLAILLSHGMDLVFFLPKGLSFDLVWIVAGFISLTEFKSNLENIATSTGIDLWSRIEAYIPRLPKIPEKPKQ